MAQSASRDDGISLPPLPCESASSSTLRSVQLDRVAMALQQSSAADFLQQSPGQPSPGQQSSGVTTAMQHQLGGRSLVSGDGSNSTPSSQSSTNSSQDSLHKPPVKKKGGGLKSSIGRIFSGKKEKTLAGSKDSAVVPRGYHTLPNPRHSTSLSLSTRCRCSICSVADYWPVAVTLHARCHRRCYGAIAALLLCSLLLSVKLCI